MEFSAAPDRQIAGQSLRVVRTDVIDRTAGRVMGFHCGRYPEPPPPSAKTVRMWSRIVRGCVAENDHINIDGTANVLKAMAETGTGRTFSRPAVTNPASTDATDCGLNGRCALIFGRNVDNCAAVVCRRCYLPVY